MKDTRIVDIGLVESNPYQSRLEFDDETLMNLARPIRESGLIQPVTVREIDGRYQVIADEQRFRTLRLSSAVDAPVLIVDANKVQMAEMALAENIQGESSSAIERAKSCAEIMKHSGLNQGQLALRVDRGQSSIADKIRLLSLDENVQEAVGTKKISERRTRALTGLNEEKQHDALEKIVRKGMTVAQTGKMLKGQAQSRKEKKEMMLKDISKNIKIAINTIHQAVSMVSRAGTTAGINEGEHESEVITTIRIPK